MTQSLGIVPRTGPADRPDAPSPRAPAWLRVAAAPVVMLAALLVASVSLAPLAAFPDLAARLNEPSNGWGLALVVAGCALVLALVVLGARLLVTRLDRRTLRHIGWTWTPSSPRLLGLGLALSLATALGAQLAAPSGRSVDAPGEPVWAAAIALLAQAVLLQGIPEELLFRGYLMQTLRRRPLLALTISTVLFGAIHLLSAGGQQGWAERLAYLTMPAAFGFTAGALLLLTRSLWPAVGIHVGFHLATLLAVLLGLGGTGPVLWLVTAAGYAVPGVLALRLWLRRGGRGTEVVLDR